MKSGEISYVAQNLLHRKTRSMLTILSILIGIMAVFALLSFGYGIKNYMDTLAQEAGADKLYIQARGVGAPGTDLNFFISEDEFNFVRKIKGVKNSLALYMVPAETKIGREIKYNYLIGSEPKENDFLQESFQIDIVKGRPLKSTDVNKVVLGYNYQFPEKIFKKELNLGDNLEINNAQFDVVGFASEVGNPSDDANLYITDRAMEVLKPELTGKYAMVMLASEKGEDPDELADRIAEKLRKYKDQDEGKEDFFVQTFADVIQTFGTIINIINGVLVLIALVSLAVAFINIMNTMYTSVLERTQEIGVMKAIGAKNSDILSIFVLESGLLGLIGGLIGLLFGYLIAKAGGFMAASAGYSLLKPIFPISLVIELAAFSFFVGALAGFLPARQASRLRPVDALRYE